MRKFFSVSLIFWKIIFWTICTVTADNLKVRDPFNPMLLQKSSKFELSGIVCTSEGNIVSLIYKDKTFVLRLNDAIDEEWRIQEIKENFILLQNLITNEQKKINLN